MLAQEGVAMSGFDFDCLEYEEGQKLRPLVLHEDANHVLIQGSAEFRGNFPASRGADAPNFALFS